MIDIKCAQNQRSSPHRLMLGSILFNYIISELKKEVSIMRDKSAMINEDELQIPKRGEYK